MDRGMDGVPGVPVTMSRIRAASGTETFRSPPRPQARNMNDKHPSSRLRSVSLIIIFIELSIFFLSLFLPSTRPRPPWGNFFAPPSPPNHPCSVLRPFILFVHSTRDGIISEDVEECLESCEFRPQTHACSLGDRAKSVPPSSPPSLTCCRRRPLHSIPMLPIMGI